MAAIVHTFKNNTPNAFYDLLKCYHLFLNRLGFNKGIVFPNKLNFRPLAFEMEPSILEKITNT
jgi:hypothetical protein